MPVSLPSTAVVITGASRGLGLALAVGFAQRGARLAICGRDGQALSEAGRRIEEAGGIVARALPLDLGRPDAARRFGSSALEALGRVDVLINNASLLGPRVPLVDYPEEVFDEVMRVNTVAPFVLMRALAPSMVEVGSGSIINVSSSVGAAARPRWGAYLASKHALEGMSRMMAQELDGSGVRINIVNPGAMRTSMRAAAYPDEDPETLRRPEDLLEVFFWLASDESMVVTGERFEAAVFE